jgi:hypothetical protein
MLLFGYYDCFFHESFNKKGRKNTKCIRYAPASNIRRYKTSFSITVNYSLVIIFIHYLTLLSDYWDSGLVLAGLVTALLTTQLNAASRAELHACDTFIHIVVTVHLSIHLSSIYLPIIEPCSRQRRLARASRRRLVPMQ